jgi:hypothetical protein
MDPERQKQVNEWLNELHGAAQRSYDTCRQLRDRLNPVIRKEPAEAAKTATPELELVDVAQAIREAVKVLEATSENHREMLLLLEV